MIKKKKMRLHQRNHENNNHKKDSKDYYWLVNELNAMPAIKNYFNNNKHMALAVMEMDKELSINEVSNKSDVSDIKSLEDEINNTIKKPSNNIFATLGISRKRDYKTRLTVFSKSGTYLIKVLSINPLEVRLNFAGPINYAFLERAKQLKHKADYDYLKKVHEIVGLLNNLE